MLGLVLAGAMLTFVIWLYFMSNPLGHSSKFMFSRFTNWFSLGMSYAFLYMARLNLNVAHDAMGSVMSNQSFGNIFAAGAFTYALSLVLNGPIVDQIGGKKGIMIATVGASLANIALGFATYLVMQNRLPFDLTVTFAVLYAINMFFQSFGAVSIIKVKAYWFHVRERGIFGAIFGTLISLGSYLAFDWGAAVVDASKAKVENPTLLQNLFQALFDVRSGSTDAVWLVFFVPSAILLFWAASDYFLVHDAPSLAGFEDFDTHDASSGEMHIKFRKRELLKKVFTNPILLLVCFIELANGVVRNGIVNWYKPFYAQANVAADFFSQNWGLMLFFGGIMGGFAAGYLSDKFFQSRRGPPVVLSSCATAVTLIFMALVLFASPTAVGACAAMVGFLTIATHALMSGTAGADFGGRKATATAAGVTDAFVYLGAGLQSVAVGYLTTSVGWLAWPLFLLPFAGLGIYLAAKMWQALPEATRRYLAHVEKIKIATGPGGTVVEVTEETIEVR